MAGFSDLTVLQKGRSLLYTVPSFPVFTAMLREVKLQWEDDDGDGHAFDGLMRECGLLDHSLPAEFHLATKMPSWLRYAI